MERVVRAVVGVRIFANIAASGISGSGIIRPPSRSVEAPEPWLALSFSPSTFSSGRRWRGRKKLLAITVGMIVVPMIAATSVEYWLLSMNSMSTRKRGDRSEGEARRHQKSNTWLPGGSSHRSARRIDAADLRDCLDDEKDHDAEGAAIMAGMDTR